MPLEIERKFLVTSDVWRSLGTPVRMRQGYLSNDIERTVRVRVSGDRARLTVKGKNTGAVRNEFEYEIPIADAEIMLESMALRPLIEKTRTTVRFGGHVWEVDAFEGDNAGLVVAEIELSDEHEPFEKPEWVGEEVTGRPEYYNSSLAQHPFKSWSRG